MGRWSFQDGRPLYVPDPGEEGAGSMLGHLATGFGQTIDEGIGSLKKGWGAAMEVPATPVMGGPSVGDVMTTLGMPARAVTATGYSLAPGGYQGTTDPIDYIMTGQKNDEADLAHYGDLLADVMEAEGTINEQGAVSKVLRDAGELISDPLVLFGLARASTVPMQGAAPRAVSSAGRSGVPARQVHGGGPGGGGWTAGGRAGGGATERQMTRVLREGAEDAVAPGRGGVSGGPGSPRQPPARYRHPPVDPQDAARFPSAPLDRDLASPGAFTTGGTKPLAQGGRPPRGATATRRAERYGRAREMGRAEQLQEGVGKMKQEQLGQGQTAMRREQLQDAARRAGPAESAEGQAAYEAMRRGQYAEAPAANIAGTPIQGIPSRAALRDLIQSAVENGASADDVMALLSNLGG